MIDQQILLEAIGIALKILEFLWDVVKTWWWVPVPFIFGRLLLFLWLYWRRVSWAQEQKFLLLELKIPKEVTKPLRAMENVFNGLWPINYSRPIKKDKWLAGEFPLPISFEIIGVRGEPHFFIRTPDGARSLVESVIYSQYPNVEISVVEDYVKEVPQDIPNKGWDLAGSDFFPLKSDIYPIKTYPNFFEERPETDEEKRIDPLSFLLEGISRLGQGERLWLQIVAYPITNKEDGYGDKAKKELNKLLKRPEPSAPKPILREAIEMIIAKPSEKGAEKKEFLPPEMKLSVGERDIVTAIEQKISKYSFRVNIRSVYLGEGESFFKPHSAIPIVFFSQFGTGNLNSLVPWVKSSVKVKTIFTWFWDKKRTAAKKKKMFRRYVGRSGPLDPLPGGTFVLNTEELASLYHFPGMSVTSAPSVPRVGSKKGEAPAGLPV